MDNVYTHCRSRGADGFAFVIHNEGPNELGESGMGLGYHQINNSLAVEFDTWHNPELLDHYENHISVQTRGWRHRNRYETLQMMNLSIIVFVVSVLTIAFKPEFYCLFCPLQCTPVVFFGNFNEVRKLN